MRIVVSFFLTLFGVVAFIGGALVAYASLRAQTGFADWMMLLAGVLTVVVSLLCWVLAALLGISKQINEAMTFARKETCSQN